MKGKIVKQQDIYLLEIPNKKGKHSNAYITNQKLAKTLWNKDYDKEYEYESVIIQRYYKGYYNIHVVDAGGKYCNLIGTNGQKRKIKELYKHGYVPSVVTLV